MKIDKNLTFAARAVMPRFSTQIVLAGALALLVLPARADTFGSGTNAFTIDFVDIGNPANGDDLGSGGGSYSEPEQYGGVDYMYRMGVTEAPQEWITKATSLGMTNVTAGAWTGRLPAGNMTWYEAAAFVNWLNTSTGHQPAYDLTYSGGWSMRLWSSGQAWQAGGQNLYRHKDAYYFLPSDDEWYKAAYHKNDGVTANYWDYATGNNTIPTAVASGTGAGTMAYNQPAGSPPATVDLNGGLSAYGTRGQNGNVIEMMESAMTAPNDNPSEDRGRRGGYWYGPEDYLGAKGRGIQTMSGSFAVVGFRVASSTSIAAVVPGQSYLLPGGGLILSLTYTLNVASSYQWQFDGTNLPGATNATLALSNLTTNNTGPYRVTVSNEFEVVTTASAAVHVVDRVTITTQPWSFEALAGTTAGFSVAAMGPLPLTYQWQRNGTNLAGKISRLLTLPGVQPVSEGDYTVVVSDVNGSVVSQPAPLRVLLKPAFVQGPLSQSVVAGGNVTFSAGITGNPAPFTYQWRKGTSFAVSAMVANVESGERIAFLRLTNVQPADAGTYRLYLANAAVPTLTDTSPNRAWNLTVLPDTDGDGLPDEWETANGLDLNHPSDALVDSDGDRMSNRAEYQSGTSPTNAASVLKLETVTQANDQATVTFQAAANLTYTVEWCAQPAGGAWLKLVDVLARPNDRMESVTDSNAGDPGRFYRVVTPRRP